MLCVAVSPDGNIVAAGLKNGEIHLWDPVTNTLRSLHGHTADVCGVAFSPDGDQLVFGSLDKTVRRWDLKSYTQMDIFDKHKHGVLSVALAPDGRIISGSKDSDVIIWGARDDYLREHNYEVTAVIISSDGLLLATSSVDGMVYLRKSPFSSVSNTFAHSDRIAISCLAFSPGGGGLISGLKDGNIHLWDLNSSLTRPRYTFTGHTKAINTLEWPRDESCFVSASKDCTMRRWNATTGRLVAVIQRHAAAVTDMVASPDGQRYVTGSRDGWIRIFDQGAQTLETSTDSTARALKIVACSPDGTLVAACTPDAVLQIVDAHTGDTLATFDGVEADPVTLVFSPDSSLITMTYGNKSQDTWAAGYDFQPPVPVRHCSTVPVAFSCDDDGWIYYMRSVEGNERKTRYCWIPPNHRWTNWARQAAWAVSILAIGTDDGMLSVLEFEPVWSQAP